MSHVGEGGRRRLGGGDPTRGGGGSSGTLWLDRCRAEEAKAVLLLGREQLWGVDNERDQVVLVGLRRLTILSLFFTEASMVVFQSLDKDAVII